MAEAIRKMIASVGVVVSEVILGGGVGLLKGKRE
jgi:hypothetical protein